ncbi:MAG: ComF family protein [Verrucomicrobiia bacterium]
MVCYFDRARAFYLSRGAVREAIHHFKYESRFWLRIALAEWLTEGFFRFFKDSQYQALVPVPLFGRRKRWRGFNQAEILAQGLARKSNLCIWNCLQRIRETETQTHLDRRERQKNVHNAFRLAKGYEVRDNDYLMIDDVFTTGSTVNECARVLKEHGARKVDVLTIARG